MQTGLLVGARRTVIPTWNDYDRRLASIPPVSVYTAIPKHRNSTAGFTFPNCRQTIDSQNFYIQPWPAFWPERAARRFYQELLTTGNR